MENTLDSIPYHFTDPASSQRADAEIGGLGFSAARLELRWQGVFERWFT
ncbi:MAG: hypothetical protein OXE87_06290 [Chloroflexi bacterium]|nr:hypothetical protein [Chloroflexota bacterium]